MWWLACGSAPNSDIGNCPPAECGPAAYHPIPGTGRDQTGGDVRLSWGRTQTVRFGPRRRVSCRSAMRPISDIKPNFAFRQKRTFGESGLKSACPSLASFVAVVTISEGSAPSCVDRKRPSAHHWTRSAANPRRRNRRIGARHPVNDQAIRQPLCHSIPSGFESPSNLAPLASGCPTDRYPCSAERR